MQSSASRLPSDDRPSKTRSRVTNGRSLFAEADARGPWARRFRDLCEAHVGDLGGAALLSEAQRSLVRRASTLECELEKLEGSLAEGQPVDLDGYGRAAAQLRRILESLGLERRAKDITPLTLSDIARSIQDAKTTEAASC